MQSRILRPILNVAFSSHGMQLKQKIMKQVTSLSFVSIAFDATFKTGLNEKE